MPLRFMRLGIDLAMLSIEAQQVIALRLMRLALGGPDALRESHRMVSEKTEAAIESGISMAAGASPEKIVNDYRSKVRANRSRLQKDAFKN